MIGPLVTLGLCIFFVYVGAKLYCHMRDQQTEQSEYQAECEYTISLRNARRVEYPDR